MEDIRLEDIIRTYVHLPSRPNGSGFYSVLCKVCSDHGRKGPRAGFRFDGEVVGYHCFNCGHKAKYNPNEHTSISKNMEILLNSFEIPENEWKQVLFTNLQNRQNGSGGVVEKHSVTKIEPDAIELPEHFYKLSDAADDDKWAIIAEDYLEHERSVDPNSYPFYLSTGGKTKKEKKWKGRLIIPVYRKDKLVYYQGRDLTGKQKKYLSPEVPKDKVLYGVDKLFEDQDMPLYVVEGWFDAYHIGGVAVYGNRMSKEQVLWLKRSRREKIIIPDRRGDGHKLAEQAIELGWKVSLPEIGDSKDINKAVTRFGKLYVLKSIIEHTYSGFAARTNVGVLCQNGQDSGKSKDKGSY